MSAAAVAAADLKTGFSTATLNGFIGQPFADPDALYSSYSTYNNWAAKVPSPLGSKSFPWVNTLGSVVPTASHHHHHTQVSPVNCFNAAATSVAGSHMGGMSVSVGQAATSMLPGMGSSLGVAGSPVAASGAACPYAAPAAPHHPYGPPVYTPHHRTAAGPESVMTSSSIASLRLKARQHSSGYSSLSGNSFSIDSTPVSAAGSPVSSRASSVGGLSACQYALTTTGEANPHSPASAEAHVNPTARAQVWGEAGATSSPHHHTVTANSDSSLGGSGSSLGGGSQVVPVGGAPGVSVGPQSDNQLRSQEWPRPRSAASPTLSSTPSSTTSHPPYLMYDEDGATADQKIEEDRNAMEAEVAGEQVVVTHGGIGVGVGIGIGGSGAAAAGGAGLAGYWQHATTATGYWPSLLDCWTTPPIASGSQSLSLPRDENWGLRPRHWCSLEICGR